MGNEQLLKEIGYRILVRRKELRLTQEILAEKMDVSIQMISNLELGKKAIRPENLVKLCSILQISADYILYGKLTNQEIGQFGEKFSSLAHDEQCLIEQLVDKLLNK